MPSAPLFWQKKNSLQAWMLTPVAWLYQCCYRLRCRLAARPRLPEVPVLCIGNLVMGGAGKTPVLLALAALLKEDGQKPVAVTRGYGGTLAGPVRVEPDGHNARQVGDEALLLARHLPCIVARDRVAGIVAAEEAGAGIILLDDGLQNPHIPYHAALLVLDGASGLGNGRTFPAGPLREPLDAALERVQGVVIIGEDRQGLAATLDGVPCFHADLQSDGVMARQLAGIAITGFAGIGRPEKFRQTLLQSGAKLTGFHAFADHHPYREPELAALAKAASAADARLVTTEKDWVRLPPAWQTRVTALPVAIDWQDAGAVREWLAGYYRPS